MSEQERERGQVPVSQAVVPCFFFFFFFLLLFWFEFSEPSPNSPRTPPTLLSSLSSCSVSRSLTRCCFSHSLSVSLALLVSFSSLSPCLERSRGLSHGLFSHFILDSSAHSPTLTPTLPLLSCSLLFCSSSLFSLLNLPRTTLSFFSSAPACSLVPSLSR